MPSALSSVLVVVVGVIVGAAVVVVVGGGVKRAGGLWSERAAAECKYAPKPNPHVYYSQAYRHTLFHPNQTHTPIHYHLLHLI